VVERWALNHFRNPLLIQARGVLANKGRKAILRPRTQTALRGSRPFQTPRATQARGSFLA